MSHITRSIFPPSVPLLNIWRELRQGIFDCYRPELHYMRGAGRNGVKSTRENEDTRLN